MKFNFDEQPEVIQKFIILGAAFLYHELCHAGGATQDIPNIVCDMVVENDIPPDKIATLLNDTMLELGLVSAAAHGEAEAGKLHNNLNLEPFDKAAVKPYMN